MQAEIITIGDEILIGQTIDTNSAWLGEQLNEIGIDVVQITTINDKEDNIKEALWLAESRSDLILMTGGLGPTKDDITKKAIANYFKSELVLDEDALDNVKEIFSKVGRELLDINKEQAWVPANCRVIKNKKGTAPGMLFQENNKIYVVMPGVPYEMKSIMQEGGVLEMLKSMEIDKVILHKTITIVDVPESKLSEQIEDIELSLPNHIKLAYLPHLNLVRLRLTGKSDQYSKAELTTEIDGYFLKIKERIGKVWFDGDRTLSAIVGEMLKTQKKTIGTIESCSGGFIAHTLTGISGSSAYFEGSLLTYSYEAKVKIASISQDLLNKVGAVSEEVAHQMAKNAQEKLGVDYCIATTGIAGPGGGTETKPVGMVFIGLAKPDKSIEVRECLFRGTRLQVIERTAYTALNMLRKELEASN